MYLNLYYFVKKNISQDVILQNMLLIKFASGDYQTEISAPHSIQDFIS